MGTKKVPEIKSKKLFDYDLGLNKLIVGTDEAGRGCGAGGVFAAAVCFNSVSDDLIKRLSILNDSKKLSKKHREEIFYTIKSETINSVVCIDVEEIERINILNASLKAMNIACSNVISQLQHELKDKELQVLVDGNKLIKNFEYPQQFIVKGDATSASIAAASILAKVSRDRYMDRLDEEFPQYKWNENAGYLTKEHMALIDKYGLSPYHRPSYLRKHFAKQEQLSLF
ncbi:ribonuclease HII [Candidatus Melainabacteria bacterium MEL.A1]|jgi:ribonuclease HII|nr:ribonuclease HII [Candidatus Melainabacteria bacterium MEL.A1]CCX79878.1 ribonuclease HII [Clostridium sp. CAG:715]